MAGESTFSKIKRIVEQEKNKKVSGEAKLSSLDDEKNRIFKQINAEVNQEVSSVEEVESICDTLKQEIESDIAEMMEVLKSEGIEVR